MRVDRLRAPAAVRPRSRSTARHGQLALFAELPAAPAPRGYRLPELVPVPAPPLHRVRRLSYSALALFERCSYRYYAERVAGLRERRGAVPGGDGGLAATEIGDAVHRLLELVDLRDPRARPTSTVVRDVVPGGDRRGARADRRLRRRRTASRSSRARIAHARGRAARAAVRVRARRRAAPRPARRAPPRRARARSSSTTRRTCSASARPRRSSRATTACSGSSTRSRASAPAPRRSRSSTRSSSGRTRSSSTAFTRGELPALEAELSAAIAPDRRRRVRRRRRASSRARLPGARRRLRRAEAAHPPERVVVDRRDVGAARARPAGSARRGRARRDACRSRSPGRSSCSTRSRRRRRARCLTRVVNRRPAAIARPR